MSPEIVIFDKLGGPLTKRICLDESGALKSEGSACMMSRGMATRTPVESVGQLGAIIGSMQPHQAIALGSLRQGLPQQVDVTTKRKLNGTTLPNTTCRSADNITFRSGQHGFALLDFDSKGMPEKVAERLERAGGFWGALLSILPELSDTARIRRASTSSGLYREDTGVPVPGSNGVHIYLAVQDVADSTRFLKTLHDRCWLAGYGWMMVGAGGQLLERSIIDRMVGAPERLVFEGAPILDAPLAQSAEARRPEVQEGAWLDTLAACPPLTVLEKATLEELCAKARHRLSGEAATAREAFVKERAEGLAKRSGMSVRAAQALLRKQCGGVLLPSIVLASTIRIWMARPSPTCWPTQQLSRGRRSPIRWRGSSTGDARRASCAAPTAHRGSTRSPMAARLMS